jgi:hypothetical protein
MPLKSARSKSLNRCKPIEDSGGVGTRGTRTTLVVSSSSCEKYDGKRLNLAQIISNPTEKGVLLQMAETWRRLASENESRNPSTDEDEK